MPISVHRLRHGGCHNTNTTTRSTARVNVHQVRSEEPTLRVARRAPTSAPTRYPMITIERENCEGGRESKLLLNKLNKCA